MKSQKIYTISSRMLPYHIVYTGPGKRMAQTIEQISSEYSPELLVSIGYAGGLSEKLKSGDIVLCRRFLCQGQESILSIPSISSSIASRLQKKKICFYEGDSYTSDKVVSNTKDKKSLGIKGALVVEMENYWAAEKARELKIPFISLRIVLDGMDFFLPDLSDTIKEDGQISFLSTLLHLLYFPKHIFSMLKLFSLTKRLVPLILECTETLAYF